MQQTDEKSDGATRSKYKIRDDEHPLDMLCTVDDPHLNQLAYYTFYIIKIILIEGVVEVST